MSCFNNCAVSSSLVSIIYTNTYSHYIKCIWSFCITTSDHFASLPPLQLLPLKKILYTKCVHTFMIYLHITFHMSNSNASILIMKYRLQLAPRHFTFYKKEIIIWTKLHIMWRSIKTQKVSSLFHIVDTVHLPIFTPLMLSQHKLAWPPTSYYRW